MFCSFTTSIFMHYITLGNKWKISKTKISRSPVLNDVMHATALKEPGREKPRSHSASFKTVFMTNVPLKDLYNAF